MTARDESRDEAREAILRNWTAQLRGMDEADTDLLAAQFTPEATLTHMTGVVQPLDAWMAGIRARHFVYHEVIEQSVDIEVTGESARLVGHILTGVRRDGSGQTWPLRVEQDLVAGPTGWLCTASRVTPA